MIFFPLCDASFPCIEIKQSFLNPMPFNCWFLSECRTLHFISVGFHLVSVENPIRRVQGKENVIITFKEEITRNSSKKAEGSCLFSVVGIKSMAKSNSGREGFISAYRIYI